MKAWSSCPRATQCTRLGSVTLRRFAVVAILAICLGGPIVEMLDQWDHTYQDGNDTEANVVVAALCIGVAIAIGTIVVVERIRAQASASRFFAIARPGLSFGRSLLASPIATPSPPTTLRV